MSAGGGILGLALGIGVLLIVSALVLRRPVTLSHRIAPYLGNPRGRVVSRTEQARDDDISTLAEIYRPWLSALVKFVDRDGGGTAALERRLDSAGSSLTVLEFRMQQLIWSASCAAVAIGLCLMLRLTGRDVAPAPAMVLLVLFVLCGWILRDYVMTRAAHRRREQVRASLPAVAELLALAVASGESAQAALDRVGRTMTGPLANECARACADTATGSGFIESLERMADRLDVVAVRRFVDGLSIAVSRGTPLAEVLRAQAADARADRHRALLEIAGRKEVLMLIPLVFLILPTVVLVALFPAMSALTSVSP